MTFQELLDENEAPSMMDFLSLDTEGCELEILESLDHNKYKFRFISVEHNNVEPNRTNINKLLTDNGYKYAGANNWDDMYVYY